MTKLRDKNGSWMSTLQTDGIADPRKVAAVEWETQLQPLTWDEVRSAWAGAVKDDCAKEDMSALQLALFELWDRGYLVCHGIVGGAPQRVYPAAVAQLFFPDDADMPGMWELSWATWERRANALLSR